MGCDIHAHFEIKVNGKWEHHSIPRIHRWYSLFGVMAGVRGPGPAIVPPRGLPPDLSVVTKLDAEKWGPDGHTHSWFGPEEIAALYEWTRRENPDDWKFEHEQLGYLAGNGWDSWSPNDPVSYYPGVEDIRLVFWFDC